MNSEYIEAYADMADFRRRMNLTVEHGEGTREFLEAVLSAGLASEDEKSRLQTLVEEEASGASTEGAGSAGASDAAAAGFITSSIAAGSGGLELSVGFDARAHKEAGINAAIASLGVRTNGDPEKISEDLKKALRERDLGLDDDVRLLIASKLAEGEGVVIDLTPEQEPDSEG